MTLAKEKDPVSSFIQSGESYLANPGVMSGMAFDDATVVLKRHLFSVMDDESVTTKLNQLSKLIRQQEKESVGPAFNEIVTALKAL